MKITITVEMDGHSIIRSADAPRTDNPLFRAHGGEQTIAELGAAVTREIAAAYGDARTTARHPRTDLDSPLGVVVTE